MNSHQPLGIADTLRVVFWLGKTSWVASRSDAALHQTEPDASQAAASLVAKVFADTYADRLFDDLISDHF